MKLMSDIEANEASIELVEYLTGHSEQKAVYRASIRPEVAKFAIEMETVLRENDHKSGWDKMPIDDLFFRIKDEFEELEESYALYAHPIIGVDEVQDEVQNIRREALDIANFCMFLCHNYPKTGAE